MAAGHRMVAEGWAMFEEAVSSAGDGDLPQLLHSLRGMMMPTPPPPATPPPSTPPPQQMDAMEQSPLPSPVKKEGGSGSGEDPVLVRVEGKIKYSCPQCNMIVTSKNGCDAHIRAKHTGKALRCAYCSFSTYNMDSLNRHLREHN